MTFRIQRNATFFFVLLHELVTRYSHCCEWLMRVSHAYMHASIHARIVAFTVYVSIVTLFSFFNQFNFNKVLHPFKAITTGQWSFMSFNV